MNKRALFVGDGSRAKVACSNAGRKMASHRND